MNREFPDINILFAPGGQQIFLAPIDESALDNALRHIANDSRLAVRVIRGDRCTTKPQLFQEWAAALQFPAYFGNNWDAFEDCLNDREWLPGELHLVCVTAPGKVLGGKGKAASTFWDILSRAATGSTSPLLRVIIQTDPAKSSATQKILKAFAIVV